MTKPVSERIRKDSGWGYSDERTNSIVDSVRALEARLEAAELEAKTRLGDINNREILIAGLKARAETAEAELARVTAERDAWQQMAANLPEQVVVDLNAARAEARLKALRECAESLVGRSAGTALRTIYDLINATEQAAKAKESK